MCGLAGMVKGLSLSKGEQQAFEGLMLVSHWRGPDATGVVWGSQYWEKGKRGINLTYLKDSLPSYEFLTRHRKTFTSEYKEDPKVLMGHCRWATIGELKRENAHPFNNKWVIGMHNGTISSAFENSKRFETDSEALLYNIGEKGLKEALEPLKYKSPAYALTWINKKDNTLNFFRNLQRPLVFARNNDGLIAWASEKEFLDFVLPRYKVHSDMVYSLKEHQLMTIQLDEPNCTDIKNIQWTDLEEALSIRVYYSGSTFQDNENEAKPNVEREKSRSMANSKASTDFSDPLAPEDLAITPKQQEEAKKRQKVWVLNAEITREHFEFLLKKGCAWCSWELDWNCRDSANWINEEEFVCDGCCKNQDCQDYVRDEQDKYWIGVKEEFQAKHPGIPLNNFKPSRQMAHERAKEKKMADQKKKRADLTDIMRETPDGVSVH